MYETLRRILTKTVHQQKKKLLAPSKFQMCQTLSVHCSKRVPLYKCHSPQKCAQVFLDHILPPKHQLSLINVLCLRNILPRFKVAEKLWLIDPRWKLSFVLTHTISLLKEMQSRRAKLKAGSQIWLTTAIYVAL